MTHFEAYILTRLDSLKTLFEISATISFIIIFILCATIVSEVEELKAKEDDFDSEPPVNPKTVLGELTVYVDKLRKIIFFIFLPVFMLSSLFLVLLPSSKEMAFIYIAPAIVNNKDFQKTIQKIPELSGLGLEYLTETLKGEIKKND